MDGKAQHLDWNIVEERLDRLANHWFLLTNKIYISIVYIKTSPGAKLQMGYNSIVRTDQ